MDERGRRHVAVRHGEGREDAPCRLGGVVRRPRVHLADRLTGLQTVPDLAAHHEPHGGVDRVALAEPARTQRDARRADRLRVHAGERTVPVGLDREDDRCRRQDACGSSTTWGSPPCASTMRRNRSSASPPSRACSARATASSWAMPSVASSAFRGEQHRQVAQPPAERPAQELDRLDDVERVPDRVAERLRHVRDGHVARRGPILAPAPGTRARAPRRPRASS